MTRRSRQYRAPDGKDWRDPNMTVTRRVWVTNRVQQFEEWLPEKNSRYHKWSLENSISASWYFDPSYNWRRK